MKRIIWLAALVASVWAAGCGDDDDMPDAALDAGGCFACPVNTVCVQKFDGTCRSAGAMCVASTRVCPAGTCTPECEADICGGGDAGGPMQCRNRILCGGELSGAFTCYGP